MWTKLIFYFHADNLKVSTIVSIIYFFLNLIAGNKEEGTNTLRLCASWPQARTSTDCKILGCHYLTRHALEHTRGQHSKERKPGFRLSAKKSPDQIRRPQPTTLS